MHLDIPHQLGRVEATTRIKRALIEARAKAGDKVKIDEERWEGDILHFDITAESQHIMGTLEVKDREFSLDAKLPFMLRLFEGQIEKAAKEQVQQMLGGAGSQKG